VIDFRRIAILKAHHKTMHQNLCPPSVRIPWSSPRGVPVTSIENGIPLELVHPLVIFIVHESDVALG
jgi:hypothetical protein